MRALNDRAAAGAGGLTGVFAGGLGLILDAGDLRSALLAIRREPLRNVADSRSEE